MRNAAVSVVLPVFNGERFLRECIQSVLSQTFSDFELIIVNDGSTDGTRDIIREYENDRRVIVIDQTNSGLVSALNHGIDLASAPLIARMDADDICFPERLARQVERFTAKEELAVLGSFIRIIDAGGNFLRIGDYPVSRAEVLAFIERGSPLAHPSVMMRKEAISAVGGYRAQYRHAEDYDLWLRMVDAGYVIENLPQPLLSYRQHATNVSSTQRHQQELATMVAKAAHLIRKSGGPDPTSELTRIDEGTLAIFPYAVAATMKKGAFLLKHREVSTYRPDELAAARREFSALPDEVKNHREMADFHLRCAAAYWNSRAIIDVAACVAAAGACDLRYVANRLIRKAQALRTVKASS